MARTTLDLDPTILAELRRRGRREGKSLGTVASELLAPALKDGDATEAPPFEWRTSAMGTSRVDLEDKDAVYAVLDER